MGWLTPGIDGLSCVLLRFDYVLKTFKFNTSAPAHAGAIIKRSYHFNCMVNKFASVKGVSRENEKQIMN